MLKTEIKKVIRSFSFILYAVAMIGMYYSQMGSYFENPITKPAPNQKEYGVTVVEKPEILMPAATGNLIQEYLTGYYVAYPYFFYKEVHLKGEEEEKIADILKKITGLSKEKLDTVLEDDIEMKVSYTEFKKLMVEVDEIIGGGSAYAKDELVDNFSKMPMTYEEALDKYNQLVKQGNLEKAYTRVFCDYMGTFLPVLAMFVVAAFWNMDRKSKVQDLMYCRDMKTEKMVGVRLLALMVTMLPVFLLPYVHMLIKVSSMYNVGIMNWMKAAGELILWLVPSLVFVTGFVAIITEIISPILAILIQGIWWYIALTGTKLTGDISNCGMIIRHNSLEEITIWENQWSVFVMNRVFYVALGVILMIALVVVYDMKRKGRMNVEFKGFRRNHYKKSVAGL